MNPLKWFRWKVVIVFAVLGGAFYLLGLNPLAHGRVNQIGEDSGDVRWFVNALNLGVLRGLFDFDGVRVANSKSSDSGGGKDKVFSAENIHVDFDMGSALRKRLSSEVSIRMPQLTVERRADGSIGVGGGEEKPEDSTPDAEKTDEKPTDWVQAIDEWIETAKKWRERLRKISGKDDEAGEETETEVARDYSGEVTYPFDRINRLIARRVAGEGLQINFVDRAPEGEASADAAPALVDGIIEILNLSENPAIHDQAIEWNLAAALAGAPVELTGTLDVRDTLAATGDPSKLNLHFAATSLPLSVVNYFAGKSLDVRFEAGTVDVTADIGIADFDALKVVPKIRLVDARMAPRAGVRSILGFPADDFCAAFNEIGTLDIDDIRIGGSFSGEYEFDLGNTIQKVAKGVITKQVDKQIEKGADKLKDVLDKELEKAGVSEVLGDDVDKVKDGLKSGLKGLLGGGDEDEK
jgi:hypothetical protein